MERLTIQGENLESLDSTKLPKYGELYWKLNKYEDLEEQGKLLILPCAVGDTVYAAHSWGIETGVVGSIEIISDRIFVNNIRGQMLGGAKEVFLTKEEAESELKTLNERSNRNENNQSR